VVEENGGFGSAGEGGKIVSDVIPEKGWLHKSSVKIKLYPLLGIEGFYVKSVNNYRPRERSSRTFTS